MSELYTPDKIKSNLVIFVFAAIISFSILIFNLLESEYKSEFELVQGLDGENQKGDIYFKLSNSGKTFKVRILRNSPDSPVLSLVYNSLFEVGFTQQVNFDGAQFTLREITFLDYTGDGNEELFLFYKLNNDVKLAIIDLQNSTTLIKDHVVESKPANALGSGWDAFIYPLRADKQNSPSYLYFYISTGHSIYPRTLYKMKLSDLSIKAKFETASSFSKGFVQDIDGDGFEEVLLKTGATYNTSNLAKLPEYDDNYDRLFLLDNNLNLLWHMECDSHMNYQTLEIANFKEESKILLGTLNRKNPQSMELDYLDFKGNVFNSSFSLVSGQWTNQLSNYNLTNPPLVLKNKLVKVDEQLSIINEVEYSVNYAYNILVTKFEGKEVIIANLNYGISIFNENLGLIGDFNSETISRPLANNLSAFEHEGVLYWTSSFSDKVISGKVKEKIFWDYLLMPVILFLGIPFILITFRIILDRTTLYQKYLNSTFNKEDALLIIADRTGKVISANSNAKNFFQFGDKSNLSQIFANYSELFSMIDKSLIRNESFKKEVSIYKENQEFRLILQYDIFTDIFGANVGSLLQFEDLTKALLKERSQVWSHAIQKVAHEIKTPLSSINLNLSYIQKNLKKDDKLNPFLESDFSLIKNEVDRIKNLTNNLLKFANLQPPTKEATFLDGVITQSFVKFESYTNHEVEIIYSNENKSAKVEVDVPEMHEVMHVLIENAIDAISARGKIFINVEESDNSITVSVENTGIITEKENLSKLFDPYYTTKKQGTGMGLAIAKKILEDHGSKLKVKSSEDKTVFYFSLRVL